MGRCVGRQVVIASRPLEAVRIVGIVVVKGVRNRAVNVAICADMKEMNNRYPASSFITLQLRTVTDEYGSQCSTLGPIIDGKRYLLGVISSFANLMIGAWVILGDGEHQLVVANYLCDSRSNLVPHRHMSYFT